MAPTRKTNPTHDGSPFTWMRIVLGVFAVVGIGLFVFFFTGPVSAQDSKEVSDARIPATLQDSETESVPYTWRAITASLIFSVQVFNYSDRYNISVAILELAEEKSYSEFTMGCIQSSFYVGFLFSSMLFGVMASPSSKWGPKWSLSIACMAWSLCTLLTPLSADKSVEMLIAVRIGLGFAEGASFPCTIALISTWFPPTQRAQISSVANCGQSLGAAFAMACSPITAYNWRIMFYVFGAIGLVWVILFIVLAADSPAQHKEISKEEQDYIERNIQSSIDPDASPASYLQILKSSAYWAACTADLAYSSMWFILISWIPLYYAYNFDLSTSIAGQLGMLSYFLAAGAVLCWGKLFDGLLRYWGHDCLKQVRLLAVATALVAPSIFLLMLLLARSSAGLVSQGILLSLTISCSTASWSGIRANLVDIGGTLNSSRIGGVCSTCNSTTGIFGNLAVGYYLSQPTLGWNAVFLTLIAGNIIGFMTFANFMQVKTVQF